MSRSTPYLGASATEPAVRSRRLVAAAAAGMALPVLWLAGALLEIRQGQLSHSLVSRPERLFGPEAAAERPILLLLAIASLIAWTALAAGLMRGADRRRLATLAGALLIAASVARLLVTFVAPNGQYLYEVSPGRGLAANALLVLLPAGLVLAAFATARSAPVLAWLSGLAAAGMVWLAIALALWSASVGARQPQLWAVEPVEALAVAWSGAAGIWLIGVPSAIRSLARWPSIPHPGRLASYALAVVTVAGLVAVSDGYLARLGPAVEAQLTGRTQVATIHVDVDRTYGIYRPPTRLAHPALVVALHPVYSSGFSMEATSHLDPQADRLGWIVAYPDGVLDGWDAFGSGPDWGRHPGVDDVAFIDALIHRLEATDGVDPNRIYVTGFSRGAMMTYRIGCELASEVAAIAPVAGNMATADGSVDVPCTPDGTVSVLAIHGTADASIPFNGGKTDVLFSPFPDVIAKWRTWNGCTGDPATATVDASAISAWSCPGGSVVVARVVQGGWHWWPVSSGSTVPTNPDDFDGARVVTDFFAAHPRAAG